MTCLSFFFFLHNRLASMCQLTALTALDFENDKEIKKKLIMDEDEIKVALGQLRRRTRYGIEKKRKIGGL